MISSISCSHRTFTGVLMALLLCAGCAAPKETLYVPKETGAIKYRVAIYPIENLSGGKAPLKELRQSLMEKVKTAGFDVITDKSLISFMARHRIRYVGGIDTDSAAAIAGEERVDAVLVTSLEYYTDSFPPKIAVTARLVATKGEPEILWMESAALSGDDAPGAFEIGLIRDGRELSDKALSRLVNSLSAGYSVSFKRVASGMPEKEFPPRLFFRSDLAPNKEFRVVVLPFYNRSGRKYAGEIMTLHFIQELRRLDNFRIVEPGVVRHQLLMFRLIMEGGVSFAQSDIVFDTIESNLLITGLVDTYLDAQGESGIPTVNFFATALDKENRTVVLSSSSYNAGDERVVFFDFGRIRTACGVALEMIRGIVGRIAKP